MRFFLQLVVIILVLFCITTKLLAGGAFYADELNHTGVAQTWEENNLKWYVDDGDLSNSVSHDKAVEWLIEGINAWTSAALQDSRRNWVDTANVSATFMGNIGEDITFDNYDPYTYAEDGKTVIIFDKDGTITQDIAPGDYQGIPGLSQILFSDSSGTKIKRGVIIYNGLLLDLEVGITEEEFKSAIVHELGHLFNLDHSQVNLEIAEACELGGLCSNSEFIPTMFPGLKTTTQQILTIDDRVTLSWIYPNETFNNSFCEIRGKVIDKDGNPLQGVNVIARRVEAGETYKLGDSRSFVSGALYKQCYKNGDYHLYGIVPGKKYEVIYEPLTTQYREMSGFEPLENPPSGFASGNVLSQDEETTVSCENGGEVIEMQTVQAQVANPCLFIVNQNEDEDSQSAGGSSGGCSLILKRP